MDCKGFNLYRLTRTVYGYKKTRFLTHFQFVGVWGVLWGSGVHKLSGAVSTSWSVLAIRSAQWSPCRREPPNPPSPKEFKVTQN
eukprot:6479946-Amphidinium_carterae.1